MADKFRHIIEDLGEDASRPGLVDTPRRAAQALLFFTKGYEDR
jgi:GTP cyclohydrolase I